MIGPRLALFGVGLAAVVALGAYIVFLNSRVDSLQSALEASRRQTAIANRQAEQAREAAEVLSAHMERLEDARRRDAVTLDEIRREEGYDAPLSDFLRGVYGRM
jgi:hypothetical protein